jgi:membrane protein DedA with SNARE-associated domain
METLEAFLPLILIQAAFQIAALIHLYRHKNTRNLNPWAWALIIILGEILGAGLYYLIGREED